LKVYFLSPSGVRDENAEQRPLWARLHFPCFVYSLAFWFLHEYHEDFGVGIPGFIVIYRLFNGK